MSRKTKKSTVAWTQSPIYRQLNVRTTDLILRLSESDDLYRLSKEQVRHVHKFSIVYPAYLSSDDPDFCYTVLKAFKIPVSAKALRRYMLNTIMRCVIAFAKRRVLGGSKKFEVFAAYFDDYLTSGNEESRAKANKLADSMCDRRSLFEGAKASARNGLWLHAIRATSADFNSATVGLFHDFLFSQPDYLNEPDQAPNFGKEQALRFRGCVDAAISGSHDDAVLLL